MTTHTAPRRVAPVALRELEFGKNPLTLRAYSMNPYTVLWLYIVLLLVGGLIGFLKAKSKVSLVTSATAAAILVVTAIPGLFSPRFASGLADFIMAALLVVFAIRLGKTKKFMPSGMLLVVTAAALVLRHVRF